jgi:hypothetical protein
MDRAPANAYTAVGLLASAFGLAVGLTWDGVGGGLNPALIVVALIGVGLIVYYERSIGRLAAAFYGVKDAVAKT